MSWMCSRRLKCLFGWIGLLQRPVVVVAVKNADVRRQPSCPCSAGASSLISSPIWLISLIDAAVAFEP